MVIRVVIAWLWTLDKVDEVFTSLLPVRLKYINAKTLPGAEGSRRGGRNLLPG
jgi:hypothetical protein